MNERNCSKEDELLIADCYREHLRLLKVEKEIEDGLNIIKKQRRELSISKLRDKFSVAFETIKKILEEQNVYP